VASDSSLKAMLRAELATAEAKVAAIRVLLGGAS
jgi:hypothetical protein